MSNLNRRKDVLIEEKNLETVSRYSVICTMCENYNALGVIEPYRRFAIHTLKHLVVRVCHCMRVFSTCDAIRKHHRLDVCEGKSPEQTLSTSAPLYFIVDRLGFPKLVDYMKIWHPDILEKVSIPNFIKPDPCFYYYAPVNFPSPIMGVFDLKGLDTVHNPSDLSKGVYFKKQYVDMSDRIEGDLDVSVLSRIDTPSNRKNDTDNSIERDTSNPPIASSSPFQSFTIDENRENVTVLVKTKIRPAIPIASVNHKRKRSRSPSYTPSSPCYTDSLVNDESSELDRSQEYVTNTDNEEYSRDVSDQEIVCVERAINNHTPNFEPVPQNPKDTSIVGIIPSLGNRVRDVLQSVNLKGMISRSKKKSRSVAHTHSITPVLISPDINVIDNCFGVTKTINQQKHIEMAGRIGSSSFHYIISDLLERLSQKGDITKYEHSSLDDFLQSTNPFLNDRIFRVLPCLLTRLRAKGDISVGEITSLQAILDSIPNILALIPAHQIERNIGVSGFVGSQTQRMILEDLCSRLERRGDITWMELRSLSDFIDNKKKSSNETYSQALSFLRDRMCVNSDISDREFDALSAIIDSL